MLEIDELKLTLKLFVCTVVINDETMKTVDKRSIYNEDLYRIEFVSIK